MIGGSMSWLRQETHWTALGLLAVAAIMCANAFVGLTASSFWFDELFNSWVVDVEHGFDETVRRALTDTHPPLYLLLLSGWTVPFGSGDAALRAFSATVAVAGVAIILLGPRRELTFSARAVAAAFAVGSEYWFYQAQNVRNYPLAMTFAAALLVAGLVVMRKMREEGGVRLRAHAALLGVAFLANMTHYYLLFATMCVYGALALFSRRRGDFIAFVVAAAVLFIIEFAYLKLVVGHFSPWDMDNSWISRDASFLSQQAIEAVRSSVSKPWAAAVAALGLLAAWRFWRNDWAAVRATNPWATFQRLDSRASGLALCIAVLVGVPALGLASSLVTTPNLTSRNIMIVSPFAWGAIAFLFDYARPTFGKQAYRGVMLALTVISASALTLALQRDVPRNEEFRASARYLETLEGCEGAAFPVLFTARGAEPGYFASLYPWVYRHYLEPGREVRLVEYDDVMEEAATVELDGCPVLAWSAHYVLGADNQVVRKQLEAAFSERYTLQWIDFPHMSYGYGGAHPIQEAFVLLGTPREDAGAFAQPE